jgi:hypothetical protein
MRLAICAATGAAVDGLIGTMFVWPRQESEYRLRPARHPREF